MADDHEMGRPRTFSHASARAGSFLVCEPPPVPERVAQYVAGARVTRFSM